MSDINWGDRPTPAHCWLEEIGDLHSEESGWYILNGSKWRHINHDCWLASGEGMDFTVHRKPDPKTYGETIKGTVTAPIMPLDTPIESYKPVVGEECEAFFDGEWRIAEALKYHKETNAVAFDFEYCLKWSSDYRPVKTEREQFIEKVADAVCSASIEQLDVKGNVKRIAGILYDARFKGPDK